MGDHDGVGAVDGCGRGADGGAAVVDGSSSLQLIRGLLLIRLDLRGLGSLNVILSCRGSCGFGGGGGGMISLSDRTSGDGEHLKKYDKYNGSSMEVQYSRNLSKI